MKTKIKNRLQLDKKWIRVMLTLSVIVIIGLSVYPDQGANHMVKSISEMPETMKSVQKLSAPMIQDTVMIDGEMSGEEFDRAIADYDNALEVPARSPASIELEEVPVLAQREPFDWKGTISWVIGAANAMVLLMMNIKNLRKK